MALDNTGTAIGAVTGLLKNRLTGINIKNSTSLSDVKVGRPGENVAGNSGLTLNLFLYEVQFDPGMKNLPLDEGQHPPLWVVLKYLLTAFDGKDSNTQDAHECLSRGIQSLAELNNLPLKLFTGLSTTSDIFKALKDNPEVLKITFDEIPPDLISKLMQNDKYMLSVGFQVRPVMIAMHELPSYSLLVGIDYTKDPNVIIGEEGVKTSIIPSTGPEITRLSPLNFEVDSILDIFGNNLDSSDMSVMIGPAELPVISQRPDKVQCRINGKIAAGVLSAGSYPVSVVRILPGGRRRQSNLLIGNLVPTMTDATVSSFTQVLPPLPPLEPPKYFGTIDIDGYLTGKSSDDIFIALSRDGAITRLLDEVFDFAVAPPAPPAPPALQPDPPLTRIRLVMKKTDAVPAGKYRVIFRVNGQQAKNSKEVTIQ